MRARERVGVAAVVTIATILPGIAPVAEAKRTVRRPDLVVTSGSVKIAAGGS